MSSDRVGTRGRAMRRRLAAASLVLGLVAAACAELSPIDTVPAGQPTVAVAAGQSAPEPATGLELFRTVGCANCHGRDGEGNIGPPMPGHTAEQVILQVRNPKGDIMPPFPPDRLSDSDLDLIVAWITGLEGAPMAHGGGHGGEDDPGQFNLTEAGHLRLVLESLAADNLDDATHHVQHLVLDARPEILDLAEALLADLEMGSIHEVEQQVAAVLGPGAEDEFDEVAAHLGMAIAASLRVDPEDVDHHLESAVEAAAGHDHQQQMQKLLDDWRADGDRHLVIDGLYDSLGLDHID